MNTYLKWLTRILIVLMVLCGFAAFYYSWSPQGNEIAAAKRTTGLVGAIGFGITAIATALIARNFEKK